MLVIVTGRKPNLLEVWRDSLPLFFLTREEGLWSYAPHRRTQIPLSPCYLRLACDCDMLTIVTDMMKRMAPISRKAFANRLWGL